MSGKYWMEKAGEGMALFPLFVELGGKKCVIVGGGEVAARKAEALLEFGASGILIAPRAVQKLQELIAAGKLQLVEREYREGDLEGAVLAIAATSDRQVNEQVYNEAVRRGTPVNTVDNPALCTFVFPACVKRDDLVIGITTSGNYPALSARIREEVDDLYPPEFGKLLAVLREFRQKTLAEVDDTGVRKEMFYRLIDEIMTCRSGWTPEKLRERMKNMSEEYGV